MYATIARDAAKFLNIIEIHTFFSYIIWLFSIFNSANGYKDKIILSISMKGIDSHLRGENYVFREKKKYVFMSFCLLTCLFYQI